MHDADVSEKYTMAIFTAEVNGVKKIDWAIYACSGGVNPRRGRWWNPFEPLRVTG
jgi:hypothetical protein